MEVEVTGQTEDLKLPHCSQVLNPNETREIFICTQNSTKRKTGGRYKDKKNDRDSRRVEPFDKRVCLAFSDRPWCPVRPRYLPRHDPVVSLNFGETSSAVPLLTDVSFHLHVLSVVTLSSTKPNRSSPIDRLSVWDPSQTGKISTPGRRPTNDRVYRVTSVRQPLVPVLVLSGATSKTSVSRRKNG